VFNNPVNLIDPLGLCAVKNAWNWTVDKFWDGMDYVSNFVAGFGDLITLGGTKWIRSQWNEGFGWYDSVDYDSTTYKVGEISGGIVGAVLAGAAISKLGAARVIGAIFGASANAWVNYDDWRSGDLSDIQYARSVVFGAGAGILSSYSKGMIGAAISGGFGAAAINIYNQSTTQSSINWSEAGSAFTAGATTGFLAGAGSAIGRKIMDPVRNKLGFIPKNHPYGTTGKGLPVSTYENPGGAVGTAVGTITTN
jgi:hypothetical protein